MGEIIGLEGLIGKKKEKKPSSPKVEERISDKHPRKDDWQQRSQRIREMLESRRSSSLTSGLKRERNVGKTPGKPLSGGMSGLK